MKITNRNARIDRAGKHNDRNFNLDNAPHIDQTKLGENKYYTYNGDTEHSFDEIEREFYEVHFSSYLAEQNRKNEEARHKERNRSVEDYARSKYTRPEDKILQIGNIKEHASGEELWECALEYMRQFNEIFGEHCMILDMALHMDEATPHVHVRRVWIAEDEAGHEYVSQTKALMQLGITAPDQEKANSKFNNPKITFTQTDTQLFRDICISRGLKINLTPAEKREHLSTLDYKVKALTEEVEDLERTRDSLNSDIAKAESRAEKTVRTLEELDKTMDDMIQYFEQSPFFEDRYCPELEMAKKKGRAERFQILSDIYTREMQAVMIDTDDFDKAAIKAKVEAELWQMENYIEEHGLADDFEQYKSRAKEERTDEQSVSSSGQSFF